MNSYRRILENSSNLFRKFNFPAGHRDHFLENSSNFCSKLNYPYMKWTDFLENLSLVIFADEFSRKVSESFDRRFSNLGDNSGPVLKNSSKTEYF